MPIINTSNYAYIYCKLPRGKNKWVFQPGDGAGKLYNDVAPVTTDYMNYSQAVKYIKKKWSGYFEIYLLNAIYND